MVHDFFDDGIFKVEKKGKTQLDYTFYLTMFASQFGTTYWWKLAPGSVRKWLLRHALENGATGAHALYRTCRAFFGQVGLICDSADHPGFVP